MKVKFLRDREIRDPKTNAVVSEFKKGQVIDLTDAGAAYFIAAGDAEASTDLPAAETPAETASEAEKPVEPRRHRG